MGLVNFLIVKARTTEEGKKNLFRVLGGSRAKGILIGVNDDYLVFSCLFPCFSVTCILTWKVAG